MIAGFLNLNPRTFQPQFYPKPAQYAVFEPNWIIKQYRAPNPQIPTSSFQTSAYLYNGHVEDYTKLVTSQGIENISTDNHYPLILTTAAIEDEPQYTSNQMQIQFSHLSCNNSPDLGYSPSHHFCNMEINSEITPTTTEVPSDSFVPLSDQSPSTSNVSINSDNSPVWF